MSNTHWETIWAFETARFKVTFAVTDETDLDLSWDDDGSTREGLEAGNLVAFVARVAVYLDGNEIAADYLGGCIYKSADEFRTGHLGLAAKSRADGCTYGDYFTDMVASAVGEARATVASIKGLHLRAA